MNKKLSIFAIPKFQQGGILWRDNVYSSPLDTNAAIQVIGTPRDVGYQQNLQNIELQQKSIQQNMNVMSDMIKTKLYQDELNERIKQNEISNTMKLLDYRTAYTDKLTNDQIDPVFREKIALIQESHGLNKEYPLTLDGITEQQNKITAYYSDPEYKKIKTHSVLLADTKTRIQAVQDRLNEWKFKNPEEYTRYDLPKYEGMLNDVRKEALKSDPDSYDKLLQLRSDLDGYLVTLTPEGLKEVEAQKTFNTLKQETELNMMKLKGNDLAARTALSEQRIKAINDFNNAKTEEERTRALETMAVIDKQTKNLLFGASEGNPITSPGELMVQWALGNLPDVVKDRFVDINGQLTGIKTEARLDATQEAKITVKKDDVGTVYAEDNTGLRNYGSYITDKTGAVKSITINKTQYPAAQLEQTNPGGITFQIKPMQVKISKDGPMETRNYAVMEIFGNTEHGLNYINGLVGEANLDKPIDEKLKIVLHDYLMGRYNDEEKVKRIMNSNSVSLFLPGNNKLVLPSDRPSMTEESQDLAPGMEQVSGKKPNFLK